MNDIAIRVENLSKQYRIGGPQARYKTIRESLTEAVQAPFCRLSSVIRGQSSAVSNETRALLEVGTDFHPTPLCPPASRGKAGRENIYLNGAIPSTGLRASLGIKRAKIERKFDEGVAGNVGGYRQGGDEQEGAPT
jgi:hypothetical protein